MEACKGNTTNIPTGSPLKQEHVRILVLPSCFLSPSLKTSPVLRPLFFSFPHFSCSLCFPQNPSTFSSQLCFFFLSRCQAPRDLQTPSPRFSFSSTEAPFWISPKNPFSLPNVPSSPKASQTSPSQHPHHTIFFPFNFGNITFNFRTPQHIQFPHFPRWAATLSLLHNSLPTKNPHGFKVGCPPKKWPKSNIKPSSYPIWSTKAQTNLNKATKNAKNRVVRKQPRRTG